MAFQGFPFHRVLGDQVQLVNVVIKEFHRSFAEAIDEPTDFPINLSCHFFTI